MKGAICGGGYTAKPEKVEFAVEQPVQNRTREPEPFILYIVSVFIRKNLEAVVVRAVADPLKGILEDGRLHGNVVGFAGITTDRDVGCRDARSPLLAGNRRESSDDTAAHAGLLAGTGDDRRGSVAGSAAAGAQDDVDPLGLEFCSDLGTDNLAELLNISAAAHESVRLLGKRADEALLD